MPLNVLHEIRVNKLGAGNQPAIVSLAQIDAFASPVAIGACSGEQLFDGVQLITASSYFADAIQRQVCEQLIAPCRILLSQLVPDAPASAVLSQVALLYQRSEMLLERVAIAVGQSDRVAHGDASMLARKLDDL